MYFTCILHVRYKGVGQCLCSTDWQNILLIGVCLRGITHTKRWRMEKKFWGKSDLCNCFRQEKEIIHSSRKAGVISVLAAPAFTPPTPVKAPAASSASQHNFVYGLLSILHASVEPLKGFSFNMLYLEQRGWGGRRHVHAAVFLPVFQGGSSPQPTLHGSLERQPRRNS